MLFIAPYIPLARMSHAGGLATYHLVRGLTGWCEVACICWGTAEERQGLDADPIRENVRLVLPRTLGLARSLSTALRCLVLEPVATVVMLGETLLAWVRKDPYYGHLTVLQALAVVEANRLIASERFDVIQVEHSALITIGRFLRHRRKVLCLYDVFQTIVDRADIPAAARRSAVRIERRGCSYYSGFITVSRKDTDFVAQATQKPVLQIAPYVEAPQLRPERTVTPCTILFFGALDRDVNQQAARFLVREVLPLLRRTVPSATLTIAGAQPPEDLRLAAAADPDHVRVTGFIPDIGPLFAAAHVFACPLFVGGGLIIKVLTAMAHGLPVVASRIAVEGTDATQGVHYLRAETAAEFAVQIERVFRNDALASELASNARSYFEEHCDWRKSIADLFHFYQALTGPGASA